MANFQTIFRAGGKALLFMTVLFCMKQLVIDNSLGPVIDKIYNETLSHVPTFRSIASYSIDCSNVKDIEVLEFIGSGNTRNAFLGIYRGEKVVVKTITHSNTSLECLKVFNEYQDKPLKEMIKAISTCSSKDTRHMLREIIYHAVLNFRPFIKNLGFCLNYTSAGGVQHRNDSTLSSEVVSIYEFGTQRTIEDLRKMRSNVKWRYFRELFDLIHKMNNTIIGPVAMVDLQLKHLLMSKGELRIYDLGMYVIEDIRCGPFKLTSRNSFLPGIPSRQHLKNDECLFGAQCVNGICQDMHHKMNMFITVMKVIRDWLSNSYLSEDTHISGESL